LVALEGQQTVGVEREPGYVRRADELGVPFLQLLAVDPTGLRAAPSNMNANAAIPAGLEELGQRGDADPMNCVTKIRLQKFGGVAGEDHGGLVTGRGRTVGGEVKRETAAGRILGACGSDVEQLGHGL
jgi:hypothetical protein